MAICQKLHPKLGVWLAGCVLKVKVFGHREGVNAISFQTCSIVENGAVGCVVPFAGTNVSIFDAPNLVRRKAEIHHNVHALNSIQWTRFHGLNLGTLVGASAAQ